jgi:hypothetical protein
MTSIHRNQRHPPITRAAAQISVCFPSTFHLDLDDDFDAVRHAAGHFSGR